MKGGKMLSVKKGVPVTFYKVRVNIMAFIYFSHQQVGSDIHLEVEGKFHMPDVLPEHMERVFKNFVPER